MLVIDGVPIILLDQVKQLRKLHGDHAAGREQDFHPTDEVVEVGNVGEDIVAEDEIGQAVFGENFVGGGSAEEFHQRRHALLHRLGGGVGGGLDAEHGNVFLHEILKQISIVA